MAKFSKALRQEIIETFARSNNGWFDPRAFLLHVRNEGPSHPAYEWFEWDDAAAADVYRLEQARDFARGLTVKFEVTEQRSGPIRVAQRTVPFATSPVDTRKDGGGYYLTDPTDGDHMQELARQAARDLSWFLKRYGAAIEHVGGDTKHLEALLNMLEAPKVNAA